MLSTTGKLYYTTRQAARVAWFMGHYFASRRFRAAKDAKPSTRVRAPADPDAKRAKSAGPRRLTKDLIALFERDMANVGKGYYPMPRDNDGSPAAMVRTSRRYFADLPVAAERKANRRADEVYDPDLAKKLPAYFLQNFHYQTGGYLTGESARLYDMQVEVLFSGSSNAMRRQCLVPLAQFMAGRDQRRIVLADIACGTGRLLRFVKQAFPRLQASGYDLSESYLAEARRHILPYKDVTFHAAMAEKLPLADCSVDVVTTVYLFHELPPKIRAAAAAEFARVLKPGGRLIFMDSLQKGDVSDYDRLIEAFPENFHEPFYPGYAKQDLRKLFESVGLKFVSSEAIFMSKLIVCDKV